MEIFKSAIDTKYDSSNVVFHNASSIRFTLVQFAGDVLLLAGDSDVVGIDEVQFFDLELANVAQSLANQGKQVVIAGLDMDFQDQPFGTMLALMCISEFLAKVYAICMKCGGVASYSCRFSAEVRCRSCFYEDFEPTDEK